MTAAKQRNTICIFDTDTSLQIPHTLETLATTARPDWIDDPINRGISWNEVEDVPHEKGSTVCIPDTDNSPWNNYAGESITDWIDDTENNKISWHDTHLITDNTTAETIPHAPLSDDDTFDVFNALDNNDNNYEAPPPPPPTAAAAAILHHPHPSSPRQLDISTFATLNTHELPRLPCDANGKLMTTEPYGYTRYKHLISMMKTKSLDIYFVQETWLEGDAFDEVINGYHVFRHNGGKSNHNFRGVAIILLP
jgi:hypothetical protein